MKKVNKLFKLLNERAMLMEELAAAKFINNIPTINIERENDLLQQVINVIIEYQLPRKEVLDFIKFQFKIAIKIQESLRDRWEQHGCPQRNFIKELKKDLRPVVLLKTVEIIKQIKVVLPLLTKENYPFLQKQLELHYKSEFVQKEEKKAVLDQLIRIGYMINNK